MCIEVLIEALDALEPELQVVMSVPMWVRSSSRGFSGRAVQTFNCRLPLLPPPLPLPFLLFSILLCSGNGTQGLLQSLSY